MATVTRENIGVLNDRITIRVDKEDYLPSFEKSLKSYSRSASIPGFRKGMVPTGMIKKMHGQAVFTDEVLRTVERELTKYMQDEKLEIFAQPLPLEENDARQLDVNNPTAYSFGFEVGLKPEFTVADLAAEKITQYKIEVSDDMVTEQVEKIRKAYGTKKDSGNSGENKEETNGEGQTGNTAGEQAGDNAAKAAVGEADQEKTADGEKTGDHTPEAVAGEAGEKEAAAGEQSGDTATTPAENAQGDAAENEEAEIELPELNEDFFKMVYPNKEIKTEADFREEVKKEISGYWEEQSRNFLQHEIYHRLLDKSEIHFPEAFLKRWLEIGGEKQKSPEEVEKEYPGFINQLKWSLINDRIGTEQQLEVNPDDIKAFAKKQLFGYMGMQMPDEEQPWVEDYLNRMMKDRKFLEDTYHRLRTDKVFEWAEARVTKEEKPISVDEFAKLTQEHQHHHH